MSEKKRQCGTCRFFIRTGPGDHGQCVHPLRKGAGSELIRIRPSEFACRNEWHDSLWQDPEDDSDPTLKAHPQQPSHTPQPEPTSVQMEFEDVITSVSIADGRSSRTSLDDDVINTGTISPDQADWRDVDQEERFEDWRRGPHSAVESARRRGLKKNQARQRELIPFAPEEPDEAPPAESGESQPTSQPVTVEPAASFPVDDFVEDERTTNHDHRSTDDALVDDGVISGSVRSRRFRKEAERPKGDKAMNFRMAPGSFVTSNDPDHREKWNTVPQLDPSIDVPLKPREIPVERVSASWAPPVSHSHATRPISQAKEIAAEERLSHERMHRQIIAPLFDDAPTHPKTKPVADGREPITSAQLSQDRVIEQHLNSPLRGYRRKDRQLNPSPVRESRNEPAATQGSGRMPATHPNIRANRYDVAPEVPGSNRPVEQVHTPQPIRSHKQHEASQLPKPAVRTSQAASRPVQLNVERLCGNCASYRTGDSADRGWCTNQWAGPVQRMVNKDDKELTCTHSYGDQWVPADEAVWKRPLRTNYPPTPRVDAMIARRRRPAVSVLPDLDELTS